MRRVTFAFTLALSFAPAVHSTDLATDPVDHLHFSSSAFFTLFADGSCRLTNGGNDCSPSSFSFDILTATTLSAPPLRAVDQTLDNNGTWMLFGWADGSISRTRVSTPSGAIPIQSVEEIPIVQRCTAADLNWSRTVDFEDLTRLLSRWGDYDGGQAVLRAVHYQSPPTGGAERVSRFWSDGTREFFQFSGGGDPIFGPQIVCHATTDFPAWAADITNDGTVGFSDLVELLNAWGGCP